MSQYLRNNLYRSTTQIGAFSPTTTPSRILPATMPARYRRSLSLLVSLLAQRVKVKPLTGLTVRVVPGYAPGHAPGHVVTVAQIDGARVVITGDLVVSYHEPCAVVGSHRKDGVRRSVSKQ